MHKPAGHRQLVPRCGGQLNTADGRRSPGMVVLVQLSQNHGLSQNGRGSVAAISTTGLENPLIVLERWKPLFQSQILAGPGRAPGGNADR